MDNIPKRIDYQRNIKETLSYYLDDDQLRLIFTVILIIGIILLISGVKEAVLFMLIGFAILAFVSVFRPKPSLVEDFVCDSFHDVMEDSRMEYEFEIGISPVPNLENRNNKFKNSSRNTK